MHIRTRVWPPLAAEWINMYYGTGEMLYGWVWLPDEAQSPAEKAATAADSALEDLPLFRDVIGR